MGADGRPEEEEARPLPPRGLGGEATPDEGLPGGGGLSYW